MWNRRDPAPADQGSAEPEASPPPGPATEAAIGGDDPYAELESVFDEPIVLEDADVQPFEAPEEKPPPPQAPVDGVVEQLTGAVERIDEVTRRLWARLEALEGEVRGGSERTLESLRRLGERMGAELAMLDKRAINLELTLARLRSITESVEAGMRRLPEPRTSTPPSPQPAAAPEHPSIWEPAVEAPRSTGSEELASRDDDMGAEGPD